MFLNRLTIEQKKAFLALALKIIAADGQLDNRERQAIEAMRYEMGLWTDTDLPVGSVETIANAFNSQESRAVALIESIAIAYSDQEMAEEEKQIIRELAIIFDFSEERATELESWVLRYIDLQKEAEKLISQK